MTLLRFDFHKQTRDRTKVTVDVSFQVGTFMDDEDEREIRNAIIGAIHNIWFTSGLCVDVRLEHPCQHGRWTHACDDCAADRDVTRIAHEMGLLHA